MRLVCFLAAAVALGQMQTPTGTIRGSVRDASGAAVPDAKVTASNTESGVRRTSAADQYGQFVLPGLPIGFWTLSAEAPGFATAETEPFQLSVGQIITANLELQPAGVVEKMDVTATAGSVDAEASSASVALGYERIEEAPARSRNYLNFVLAAPGVSPAAGSASQRTMTGVRSAVPDTGFTFGGMRPRNNSIRIDGMDNRDETTGGNRVAIGLEMVQEFRVSGISVGAELGGAAGGLLNMVTRSGVNLWHGDVTGFLQNEVFNANRAEIDAGRKARFRRYQPGVSAMGPLRRDRTFIAAAIEHETEQAEEFSNISSLPVADVPFGIARGVGRGLYDTSTRGVELSTKLDHLAGGTDTFSARYAFSRGRVRHEVQGPDNFADRSAQGSSLTMDHSLVGSWLRVFGPTRVNEIRVQVAERSMDLSPNARGPMFELPGVVTFGQYFRMDGQRTERHYEIVESFHFTLGPHRLNAGADLHVVTLDSSLRDRYAGIYVFPTVGDLMAGTPDLFIQAFGDPRTRMRTSPSGFWLQDRWEARRQFTLELGLRYEHQLMPDGMPSSSHNFAPRFGMAWRAAPGKPLVVRLGAGLFFDRYPLAWLNPALQRNGIRGFEQYAAGMDAIRALQLSRGMILSSPLANVEASEYRIAPLTSTFSRKISAGVEYGLSKETSLSIEATQIRGLHLPRVRNANGTLPPSYLLEAAAESSYRGLTVSLNRRLHNEFGALLSYSYGRTRDNGSDYDEHPSNPLNANADWGPSRQDQRHRLAASALFELPVDDAAWMPSAIREALEQVSVAPIFTVGSGRPINALLTTDLYRTGAYPLSARPAGFGRNPFRLPEHVSLDVRVMKTFPVLENRAVLQFGIESFNLLNHTNPERVSHYFEAAGQRLPTYGGNLESLPARQVQFLVQFEF